MNHTACHTRVTTTGYVHKQAKSNSKPNDALWLPTLSCAIGRLLHIIIPPTCLTCSAAQVRNFTQHFGKQTCAVQQDRFTTSRCHLAAVVVLFNKPSSQPPAVTLATRHVLFSKTTSQPHTATLAAGLVLLKKTTSHLTMSIWQPGLPRPKRQRHNLTLPRWQPNLLCSTNQLHNHILPPWQPTLSCSPRRVHNLILPR